MTKPVAGPTVLSLFSGCGGLDLGFEQARFNPVLAVEIDQEACNSYALNRPSRRNRVLTADLSSLSAETLVALLPGDVRGVIGGPPCQAFSESNVNKYAEDPRSLLPINYAKILKRLNRQHTLDFFVFENVLGLKSARHADELATFRNLFDDAGFALFEGELDAADFGVAQHRRRVFIVGLNRARFGGVTFEFPAGDPGTRITVREKIGALPEPVLFERGLTPEGIKNATGFWNHWSFRPRSAKFANKNGELVPGDRRGRSFRVLDWDKPSMTVAYGHREVHVHPGMHRRLSVREALRLQGFPDSYRLTGTLSDQTRMVSDAVPPPLARALAEQIRGYL